MSEQASKQNPTFQMIVNNGTDKRASFTVTPVQNAPIVGDLDVRCYAAIDVTFAESYIVSIDDAEVTVRSPNACISRVVGHDELIVTQAANG